MLQKSNAWCALSRASGTGRSPAAHPLYIPSVRYPDTPNLHLLARRFILHPSSCRNVIEGFTGLLNVIALEVARASITAACVASVYVEFKSPLF